MKVKLTYSLQNMYVSRRNDLPAHFSGVDGAKYFLWIREVEHEGKPVRQLCCDIVCDVKPPARAKETLLALRENRLLLDDPIQEGLPKTSMTGETIVDLNGNVKPKWMVDFDLLPSGAKPWFRQIATELSFQLTSFVKQLRWFQHTTGGHRPWATVGTFWSLDGEEWNRFPSDLKWKFSQPRPIEASDTDRVKMEAILNNRIHEPVSHDLIREAGELVGRAPRSALLVAFAALEAGVKLQLSRMVPDASALIDKMPSPPLNTLLQEILPRIIETKGIASDHFPLKKRASDYLKKWVTQRNQVTHGTKHSVETEKVEDFILFAKDILYLLDHLNGHDWALDHLESEVWAND